MFLLPGERGSVPGERSFTVPEGSRVMHVAPRVPSAGEHLMEHLVEHDVLDEEERNVGPIERRVHSNLARPMIVDTQANRLSAAASSVATPADARSNGVLEVERVESLENLGEIEALSARAQRRGPARFGANALLPVGDVVVENLACGALSTTGVVGDGFHDGAWRLEEKVVHAKTQEGRLPAEADHRASVVVYREQHLDVGAQERGDLMSEDARGAERLLPTRGLVRRGRGNEGRRSRLAGPRCARCASGVRVP